ncbi:MAG: indolepyruvate ferredoxin oxidoreductase subunit alpha [Oscillospiraceae bacterium]|jgi:indolepyruvate ferredoxin oxidoreductase alpha subunit|nr:indolepyruvate ferredoxin oxidoreductase subunit alpha [Oscillospiraceae bacterium]
MPKRLLMGNEAIALGALRAGVRVVTGYPGTPSTEILETVAKAHQPSVHVEWSVNEKTALEVAAGAAWAGARALVTMKQVGLNVASDPLMSLNYVGVKAGMVIAVADDPGPISSQTEQDTRRFGEFAKLVVFDPSSPEEAYLMVADAFAVSEQISRPVILRPTTRVCHSYATIEVLPDIPQASSPPIFDRDKERRVIFPALTKAQKPIIETTLHELATTLADYHGNVLRGGEHSQKKGIACGGVSFAYAQEALKGLPENYKLLKVGTVPFPKKLARKFLAGLDKVLVLEELDPVIEDALVAICGQDKLPVRMLGKRTDTTPNVGENTVDHMRKLISEFLTDGKAAQAKNLPLQPQVPHSPPPRPPVLCAGCPHRGAFFAVKQACKDKHAAFCGDIGCYTLGNAPPLDMVDTCLCMGAGISAAQGLKTADPALDAIAFVGDSTFFHTGIPGIINAVYNHHNILVCVLDNRNTAMTGSQPHPGLGKNAVGEAAPELSIPAILTGIGGLELVRVNAFDVAAGTAAVHNLLGKPGVRVIIFEGACIAVDKTPKAAANININVCTGCGACIRRFGCPAIIWQNDKAAIDLTLCTGCSACFSVCPTGAIGP